MIARYELIIELKNIYNMKSVLLTCIIFFTSIAICKAQVAEKAEDISPLMISEKVPAVEIISLDHEAYELTYIVKEKRSILLFYRGGWCPYCNAHLSAVGQVENEILELGYQVIAISPDSPEELRNTLEKEELKYALYSDADGALIQAMGLAFKASDRQQDRLIRYSDGQNPGLLPVPSLFIVDTDGTILFEYISPDYKHRMSADLLLVVLEQLNEENK